MAKSTQKNQPRRDSSGKFVSDDDKTSAIDNLSEEDNKSFLESMQKEVEDGVATALTEAKPTTRLSEADQRLADEVVGRIVNLVFQEVKGHERAKMSGLNWHLRNLQLDLIGGKARLLNEEGELVEVDRGGWLVDAKREMAELTKISRQLLEQNKALTESNAKLKEQHGQLIETMSRLLTALATYQPGTTAPAGQNPLQQLFEGMFSGAGITVPIVNVTPGETKTEGETQSLTTRQDKPEVTVSFAQFKFNK